MIKLSIAPTFIAALLVTSAIAAADCAQEDLVENSGNLMSRIDAMAACIAQQGKVIAQQNQRLARLESTVLISEVPCTDLGEGWQLHAPANGRFIIGAGDRYALGAIGGAETVTLSLNHIPSHSHAQRIGQHAIGGERVTAWNLAGEGGPHTGSHTAKSGAGAAHENMPPYVAMYFCKLGS